jgi:S-formylglutathione hydrolase FrmB
MALLTVDLFSESLEMGTSLTVVLPQAAEGQIGVEPIVVPEHGWPVLYLLHGLSDDHTAWLRYTSIERHARAAGLAVVMPAAGRSFYTDEARGYRYWTWISDELPRRVSEFFRVSQRPEDTYVAGLSMGGYGALKLGFSFPERYAGAASLSGAVDLAQLENRPERAELVDAVFGGTVPAEAKMDHLLDQAEADRVPPLYIGCGTDEDRLIGPNQRLAERAAARGIDVTTDFRPGEHEWGLWDAAIPDVIAWLPRAH